MGTEHSIQDFGEGFFFCVCDCCGQKCVIYLKICKLLLFVGCFFFFCGKLLELVKLEAHDSSFELLPVKTLYVITYVITFYD